MTQKDKNASKRKRRKPHWRTQMCGPGRTIRRRIWVRAAYIKVKPRKSDNYELPL